MSVPFGKGVFEEIKGWRKALALGAAGLAGTAQMKVQAGEPVPGVTQQISRAEQETPTLKNYHSSDIGYTLPMPSNLHELPAGPPPETWYQPVVQKFASEDGQVNLTVSGYTERVSFKKTFDNILQAYTTLGSKITYKVFKGGWFVFSGTTKDRQEFYAKAIESKGGELPGYLLFYFSYPADQSKIYDPLVARMSHEFKVDASNS
jgi:hypothetical protein